MTQVSGRCPRCGSNKLREIKGASMTHQHCDKCGLLPSPVGYNYYLYFRRDEPRISSSEYFRRDEPRASSSEPTISISLSPSPPKSADLILCIFVPRKDQEVIIGDLQEQFPKWVERFGLRLARFIYFKEVCTTIYPVFCKLLVKLGALTGIEEFIRWMRH